MALNVVQCLTVMLVVLIWHPSSAAHLPTNLMDSINSNTAQFHEDNGSSSASSGEESNIILLNNINKKIWDASSLAPG